MSHRSRPPHLRAAALILLLCLLAGEAAGASLGLAVPTASPSPDIFAFVKKLPADAVSVDDVFDSGISGAPALVLIQDAHTNPSAQFHIARTIESILDHTSVRQVFLESGSRDLSLTELKSSVDRQTRERVASQYLRKGLLQGSEYANLLTDRDFELWGVENRALYTHALRLYAQAVAGRADALNALAKYRQTAEFLSEKILSAPLKRLSDQRNAYFDGRLPLTEYAEALERASNAVAAVHLPEKIKSLKNLRKKESEIDFAAAAAQLARLDGEAGTDDWMSGGKIGHGEMVEWGRSGAASRIRNRVSQMPEGDRMRYSDLSAYLDYRSASEELLDARFLESFESWESSVIRKAAKTEDEARWIQAREKIRDWEHLLLLQADPGLVERIENSTDAGGMDRPADAAAFLNRKLMELGAHPERALVLEPTLESTIRVCRAFYRLALLRDHAMLRNALHRMRLGGSQQAALVVGGFHAKHLQFLLKRRNLSYVSLVPKVAQPTDAGRYEKLLLSQVPSVARHGRVEALGLLPSRAARSPLPYAVLKREMGAADSVPADSGSRLAVPTAEINRAVEEIAGWIRSGIDDPRELRRRLRQAVIVEESTFYKHEGSVVVLSLDARILHTIFESRLRPSEIPWRYHYVSTPEGSPHAFRGLSVIYGDAAGADSIRSDGQVELTTAEPVLAGQPTAIDRLNYIPLFGKASQNVRLGISPFSGAAAHIVADPQADRKEVLRLWAEALGDAQIIGRVMMMGPGNGMKPEDMDKIFYSSTLAYIKSAKLGAGEKKRFETWFDSEKPGPMPRVVPFMPAVGLSTKYGGIARDQRTIGSGSAAAIIALLRYLQMHAFDEEGQKPEQTPHIRLGFLGGMRIHSVINSLLYGHESVSQDSGLIFQFICDEVQAVTGGSDGISLASIRRLMNKEEPVGKLSKSDIQALGSDLEQVTIAPNAPLRESLSDLDTVNVLVVDGLPGTRDRDLFENFYGEFVIEASPYALTEEAKEALKRNGVIYIPYTTINIARAVIAMEEVRTNWLGGRPDEHAGTYRIPSAVVTSTISNLYEIFYEIQQATGQSGKPDFASFLGLVRKANQHQVARSHYLYRLIWSESEFFGPDTETTPHDKKVREHILHELKLMRDKAVENKDEFDQDTAVAFLIFDQVYGENFLTPNNQLPYLIRALESDKTDSTELLTVIYRLSKLPLIDLTPDVVSRIVQGLARRLTPRSGGMRQDPDIVYYRVRAEAARALGRFASPEAVRTLGEMGKGIRHQAMEALTESFLNPLEANPLVREWIVDSLRHGEADFEGLIVRKTRETEARTDHFYSRHPEIPKPTAEAELPDPFLDDTQLRKLLALSAQEPPAVNIQTELIDLANEEFALGVMCRYYGLWKEAERHFRRAIWHWVASEKEGGALPRNIQRNVATAYHALATEALEAASTATSEELARKARLESEIRTRTARFELFALLLPDEMGSDVGKAFFEPGTLPHRKNLVKFLEISGYSRERSEIIAGLIEDVLVEVDSGLRNELATLTGKLSPSAIRNLKIIRAFRAYSRLIESASDFGFHPEYLRLLLVAVSPALEGQDIDAVLMRRMIRFVLTGSSVSDPIPLVAGAVPDNIGPQEFANWRRADNYFYDLINTIHLSSTDPRQGEPIFFYDPASWIWTADLSDAGRESEALRSVLIRQTLPSDVHKMERSQSPELYDALRAHVSRTDDPNDPDYLLPFNRGLMLVMEDQNYEVVAGLAIDLEEIDPQRSKAAGLREMHVSFIDLHEGRKVGMRAKREIYGALMTAAASVGATLDVNHIQFWNGKAGKEGARRGASQDTDDGWLRDLGFRRETRVSEEWEIDRAGILQILSEADRFNLRTSTAVSASGARIAAKPVVSVHSEIGKREEQQDRAGHAEILKADGGKIGDLILAEAAVAEPGAEDNASNTMIRYRANAPRMAAPPLSWNELTTNGVLKVKVKGYPDIYVHTKLIRRLSPSDSTPAYWLRIRVVSEGEEFIWSIPEPIEASVVAESDEKARRQLITKAILTYLESDLKRVKRADESPIQRFIRTARSGWLRSAILSRITPGHDPQFATFEIQSIRTATEQILSRQSDASDLTPDLEERLKRRARGVVEDLNDFDRFGDRLRLFVSLIERLAVIEDDWVSRYYETYGPMPLTWLPGNLVYALKQYVDVYAGDEDAAEQASEPVVPVVAVTSTAKKEFEPTNRLTPFLSGIVPYLALDNPSSEPIRVPIEMRLNTDSTTPVSTWIIPIQKIDGAARAKVFGEWVSLPGARVVREAFYEPEAELSRQNWEDLRRRLMEAVGKKIGIVRKHVDMTQPHTIVVHLDGLLAQVPAGEIREARLRSLGTALRGLSDSTTLVIESSDAAARSELLDLLKGVRLNLASEIPAGQNHTHLLDPKTLAGLDGKIRTSPFFRSITLGVREGDVKPDGIPVFADEPAVAMADVAGRSDLSGQSYAPDFLYLFFKNLTGYEDIRLDEFTDWLRGDSVLVAAYPIPPALQAGDAQSALRLYQLAARLAGQSA